MSWGDDSHITSGFLLITTSTYLQKFSELQPKDSEFRRFSKAQACKKGAEKQL